ncbi:response regulator [Pedobacter sp. MC2016-05]|uniref:hybrid sensor histidine kinase/response regulator transcription factor n=1 Tax=Pedobacter sp. MC2016-05 TaxID=2994474 RepID=UPI002245EEE1|nr:two-component regulator propeller domain-containing protein [Pedobacter sp. MC2016-05]MCX2473509.1 response regulator [Pedobacter sp. MC2016-05]
MIISIRMFFSFCLVIISSQYTIAQVAKPYFADERWGKIKSYTIADGLPSKNTTATLQDKRGFIWIGTQNGLCRFDGFTFKIYSSAQRDKNSLTNNYVNALCEDRQGKIWVATMDGLNLFDPLSETFERFYHEVKNPGSLSNNKVWSLLCDNAGVIWVGTDDGLNKYKPHQKKFRIYRQDPSRKGSMAGKSVNAIIEDSHHNIWLGSWSAGLSRFNPQTESFTNFPQPRIKGEKNPNDIWSLCVASNGNIWVGTYWSGLFSFDLATEKFSKIESPGSRKNSVFSISIVDKSSILIGENSGFYLYDIILKRWTRIGKIENYANGRSYKDQQGNIWINAVDGIYLIIDQPHKFLLKPLPLSTGVVSSIISDHTNTWIGADNGLIRIDQKTGRLNIFTKSQGNGGLKSNIITKLYKDSKGVLWVLTENGFYSFNEHTNLFTNHHHHSTQGNLYNEDVFRDILELEKDVYVLATDAGIKIYHRTTEHFDHFHNESGNSSSINNNHTYKLCKSADGKIWIGTYGGGVNVFDRTTGKFESITTENGLSSNVINDILRDSKKNIWISTTDGLNQYNANKRLLRTFSNKDGFASNVFKDIEEDYLGTLWVITESGISSLDPSSGVVSNFDDTDGFSVNSVLQRRDNLIVAAGSKGYFSFDPKRIQLNKPNPVVFLTDFQILNKSVLPSKNGPLKDNILIAKEVSLDYDQSIFSLEFVAPEYKNPKKIKYAYRLSGFDQRWNKVGNQRKATYTNLNPGLYRFEVTCYRDDKFSSNRITTLIIRINPPWYLTWWAYVIYAATGLFLCYLYITYRKKQVQLKYQIQMAHLESEKEKEISERKSAFFTNISHEFRTPLTLIINPVKDLLNEDNHQVDNRSLNIVYRNAKRLLGLVDQLIRYSKAEAEEEQLTISKFDIVKFAREIFICFEHQATTNGITYQFESPSVPILIYADIEKMEIVIFNLLSNAFKFTPHGGSITLGINDADEYVSLIVQDSGCGIPLESQTKIFNRFYQESFKAGAFGGGFGIGLYLVKTFIEMHKGRVSCSSDGREGTIFRVEVLKGDAYIDPLLIAKEDSVNLGSIPKFNIYPAENYPKENLDIASLSSLIEERKTILIIDDNEEIANYLEDIFTDQYHILQAWNGESGLAIIRELLPDIVISDVMMGEMGGIELCRAVKEDESISHIPIVLLTASKSEEIKLKGIESGADDFFNKPFDKKLLIARVAGILKSKNSLQKYFYSEITLNTNSSKISSEYKEFLNNCISIVEKHMENADFSIKLLAEEIGMSRETLFKKIKSISGHSPTSFIRFIRLRKAAQIFITTDNTIRETMFIVGINDIKYFREQFRKIFEMNPSEYIKKYRKTFANNLSLNKDFKVDKPREL